MWRQGPAYAQGFGSQALLIIVILRYESLALLFALLMGHASEKGASPMRDQRLLKEHLCCALILGAAYALLCRCLYLRSKKLT